MVTGINREAIAGKIEESEILLRVSNTYAKFPNVLEITLQERYPMYKIGDKIYDYELVEIGDLGDGFVLKNDDTYSEAPVDLGDFSLEDDEKTETLILMARLFFNQSYEEASLCHMMCGVTFTSGDTIELQLKFAEPKSTEISARQYRIKIENFGEKFAEKLQKSWGRVADCDVDEYIYAFDKSDGTTDAQIVGNNE